MQQVTKSSVARSDMRAKRMQAMDSAQQCAETQRQDCHVKVSPMESTAKHLPRWAAMHPTLSTNNTHSLATITICKRHSLVIVTNGRQDANLNESRAVLDSTHHAVHPQHHVGREIDRSRLVPGDRRMHRWPCRACLLNTLANQSISLAPARRPLNRCSIR